MKVSILSLASYRTRSFLPPGIWSLFFHVRCFVDVSQSALNSWSAFLVVQYRIRFYTAVFPQLQLWHLHWLYLYSQRALHFETLLHLLKRIGVWMANTDGTSSTDTGAAFVVCSVRVKSELSSVVCLMTLCRQWLAVSEGIWLRRASRKHKVWGRM